MHTAINSRQVLFFFLYFTILCSPNHRHGNFVADGDYHLTWSSPKTDMLVDYLAYYQHWEPSYTRQRMLPILSTIFLRDVASNSKDQLLCGQYEFDSIQRVKTRFGHQLYVINWKKTTREMSNEICIPSENPDMEQELRIADDGSKDLLDEPEVLQIHIKDGCSFLSTEEDMELVQSAFPEKVSQFLRDKVKNNVLFSLPYFDPPPYSVLQWCLFYLPNGHL